jgi:5,10-methylenetetrahydrofolate reductase
MKTSASHEDLCKKDIKTSADFFSSQAVFNLKKIRFVTKWISLLYLGTNGLRQEAVLDAHPD